MPQKRKRRSPWKKLMGNLRLNGHRKKEHDRGNPEHGISGSSSRRVIEVTEKDLKKIYEKQKGKCYWFDIELNPMDIFITHNPMAMSVDRIDNDRDYYKDNIVICCRLANLGRGTCGYKRFKKIIRNLKNEISQSNK
tara:strand:- start:2867 stop:3277 length:411 start_codon:yes stop_codon:yes gene_type:complete